MGKFRHYIVNSVASRCLDSSLRQQWMTNPGKVSFLTPDFGSNFSALERYIDSQLAGLSVQMSWNTLTEYISPHVQYKFCQAFCNGWRSFGVNLLISRPGTSEFSLTHQFREQPDGEPEPASPRPRLSAFFPKTLLVLPKFHWCFSFDLHCNINRKTFSILQTQDT